MILPIKSMSGCCVATPRKFSMSANLDVTHHLSAPGTGRLGTAELFLKRRSGTAARPRQAQSRPE
jgi:hypothetical protein